MAGRETLGELALRKQALILESELNRLTLRGEYQNVRAGIRGLGTRNQSGWWWLLAPVAGFFAIRLFHPPDSVLNRMGSLLKWLTPVWTLWKSFGGSGKPKDPPAS
jgi:hypothetical protein